MFDTILRTKRENTPVLDIANDDRDKIYFRTFPIIVNVNTPSYKCKPRDYMMRNHMRTTIINTSYHVIVVYYSLILTNHQEFLIIQLF